VDNNPPTFAAEIYKSYLQVVSVSHCTGSSSPFILHRSRN